MFQVQKIEISGYRSLKSIAWEPDRLNVVIGPNGSGKSNLLRALELLRESADGNLRKTVLTEGGLGQLLWDHRAEEVSWTLKLRAGPSQSVTYHLALNRSMPLSGAGFKVAKEFLLDSCRRDPSRNNEPLYLLERDPNHAVIWDSQEHKLVAPPNAIPQDNTLLSAAGIFGDPVIFYLRTALWSFDLYHDLVTHRGASSREAAVARVEKSLSSDGSNLVPVLHTLYSESRDFKQSVDAGMRAAFGDDFEGLVFGPAADQRVQLQVRWKSLNEPVSAANLSDGTVRFLMLLAILANPEPSTIIAIDEPETGLHPRMFPIIAEFAASASEHSTVVLTTHSPEFLDAFPSDCIPTTTVAECVEGETKLSKLDPGELDRWLREYSLGKLFRSGELEALS